MASQHQDVFRLYLLRHARAAWPSPGQQDYDRALDATGIAEARNVARQAHAAGVMPGILVSSPARRCAGTTAAFLEIFANLTADYDGRLYSEGQDAYLDQIRKHRDATSLMLVGHNPMIESLAGFLGVRNEIGGIIPHGYPTAGLLALDFPRSPDGSLLHRGRIALFLTPALT
jgi:phosphohistidine phosphatase